MSSVLLLPPDFALILLGFGLRRQMHLGAMLTMPLWLVALGIT